MSYSSAKPKPPCVCRQVSAACQEASDASSFAMLASVPQGMPASNSDAALRTIRLAASVSTWLRAMGNWMPWLAPMGRPNTSRSFA